MDVSGGAKETKTVPGQLLGSDGGIYQVFARKYRPQTFSELIGQEVLVRTLSNAFTLDRLAHAYILSGVRGIGKTTTARIIARALNCIGVNGEGGPTAEPCGECENCRAIAEDRHVDVLEMDAASRTGVSEIRELIDGVRYRPTSARFKVYIIDEAHMLSSNAFNALLKTLEEPPEHVKFIFATTEIRKVPVTVLSRCQRFDLARVNLETLTQHLGEIIEEENARIEKKALYLIAQAAEGSVRDGLSILDQAVSQAKEKITEAQIREMLGLADRTQTFDLLEAVLSGDISNALDQFDKNYCAGADPLAVLMDMLDIVHFLTRIKIVPAAAESSEISEVERVRGREMEPRLKMPVLARLWQMLLKGVQEVRFAPSARQAAEMLLVRIAYTSTLPTPEDALKQIKEGDVLENVSASVGIESVSSDNSAQNAIRYAAVGNALQSVESVTKIASEDDREDILEASLVDASYGSFAKVVSLAETRRELVLKAHLENDVHVVTFAPGHLEFRPSEAAPLDLAGRLTKFLNEQTDRRWLVTVSQEIGEPTIAALQAEEQKKLEAKAAEHPLVQSVIEAFPGAKLAGVKRVNADAELAQRGSFEEK